jgi:hypothetical protein
MDKTTIVAEVALRTQRRPAEIRDAELNAALMAFTLKMPNLIKECYTTTTRGQAEYDLSTFPNRLRYISSVTVITDNISDNVGLRKYSDFEKYKSIMAGEQEADYDVPNAYLVNGLTLYLYPTPKDAYEIRLVFSALDYNINAIQSTSEYFEPIVDRACYEVYKNRGQADTKEAQTHLNSFMMWVRDYTNLTTALETRYCVNYTDI